MATVSFFVFLTFATNSFLVSGQRQGDGPAAQPKPRTLAYDGFSTGTAARSYLSQLTPSASGAPMAGMVGFSEERGWTGKTKNIHIRDGSVRSLTHPLLEKTQPGSLGQWRFNGTDLLRRKLAQSPIAKSGVYTMCLLYRAHDNFRCNLAVNKNHTTNFPGAHGTIGFNPEGEKNDGKRGLSLGFYEDDLRVFAGGKSFTIVPEYNEDSTYLLIAEMTADANGAEHIRGFFAGEKDPELKPAPFNKENNGKGVKTETWSAPNDLSELEIRMADAKNLPFPIQASPSDLKQDDLITWDEIRLLDGRIATPIPADPSEDIVAKPSNRTGLVSHWPFDERKGKAAKDAVGKNHLTLKQARFTRHSLHGGFALQFEDRDADGSDMASLSFDEAEKNGLAFDRGDKLTISAWVRGITNGRWGGLNDIVTMCRSGQEGMNKLRDVRGMAFSIANHRLRFDLINSVNFPRKDNRLTVAGLRKVRDDAKFHHVAVTYDGSSTSDGVSFFIDGEKDSGFSINFETQGSKLTGSAAAFAPFNIGGRNDDHKDLFNFGFSGYIDEVGVFVNVLSDGEVAAIYELGMHKKLGYNLKQVNQLIELHRRQKGSVQIAGKTWVAAPDGALMSGVGLVDERDGAYSLQIDKDGSGVRTK